MTRPSPTPFQVDMAMAGKRPGVDPIPKSVTSRPDPGEYGGMYDQKPAKKKAAEPEPAPVEEKNSEPEQDTGKSRASYKTRDAKGQEWG